MFPTLKLSILTRFLYHTRGRSSDPKVVLKCFDGIEIEGEVKWTPLSRPLGLDFIW